MSKASNSSLFFYYDNKLVTVKHGDQHRAILRNAEQPLAELSTSDTHTCSLLATDDKGSGCRYNKRMKTSSTLIRRMDTIQDCLPRVRSWASMARFCLRRRTATCWATAIGPTTQP